MVMHSDGNIDLRIEAALRGERLYGDDFTAQEIASWFADEVDGYAGLDHTDSQTDAYFYYALDAAYAWSALPRKPLKALGFGSAWGSEFKPIAERLSSLTIVEPGNKFWRDNVAGIPTQYVMPDPSGRLPFEDESFDVISAFGVMHHIPNVRQVLAELARVLRPGGQLLIREPITSMGDWRQARRGLTRRERGLPRDYVARTGADLGLELVRQRFVGFAPLVNLATRQAGAAPWNRLIFVKIDSLLSRMTEWNWSYHRTSFLKRFAPTLGCWVLVKPASNLQP